MNNNINKKEAIEYFKIKVIIRKDEV